ncbi:MAG TPA: peptidylprolyl isomerase [Leptolyngbyaceae cyanobacterium M65_K2018_010]|nr:peptidylprolyl isomerase [Leptolyngbyaceae cyanobacterium M65_K2018_010]
MVLIQSPDPVSLAFSSESYPPLQVGDQLLDASELVYRIRRYGLMPALVKEIVIDQAIASIPLAEAETATAVESFLATHQLTSEDQRDAFLHQRGLTLADLEPLARRDRRLQKFKAETWGNQIESYFLQRKTQMDRVLYSLIRTKEPGLAQELFFRIQDDGQPFADLARQFSEGQEAQTGGLIGPVELAVPHPALAKVLSISQPGQLWPPTRVGEWFVIVRLEKFLPAKLDQANRQRLLDELFNTWLVEQVQQVLKANRPEPPAATTSEVSEPG